MGRYIYNKELESFHTTFLNTGTKTNYFLSALAYIMKIPQLCSLDNAILLNTNIYYSLIKMGLGLPSFYEKFGYQPFHLEQQEKIRQLLMEFALEHNEFYIACFNYVNNRIPFKFSDMDPRLEEIANLYQESKANKLIKNITQLDLLYWQPQYE